VTAHASAQLTKSLAQTDWPKIEKQDAVAGELNGDPPPVATQSERNLSTRGALQKFWIIDDEGSGP